MTTETASNLETARKYLALQGAQDIDGLVGLMADNVIMNVPMLGTLNGKEAIEKQLRGRPMGANITWSDPEEDEGAVRMVGTGAPFGPVTLMLSFNDAGQVSRIDITVGAGGGQGFQRPPLNFAWASVPTERPPRPSDLGEEGFTLRKADAGSYGWAPDHWPYQNDTPRGAWPAAEGMRGLLAPYTIYEKHQVWADNAADLYELAIRERWAPATQVAWGSIEPLADHIEASLDQIFTNISEIQYNSNQILMGWFKEISYGYHEVKLFLSTQVFDQARHVEAFRKRALSNGGGLGVQTPGFMNRTVYAAFKFSEYVTYVNILRASFLLTLCEWGDRIGRSQADKQLFENTAHDLRRHMAYGVDHLRHYLRHDPVNREHVTVWLNRGEAMLTADLRRDKPLREALILALGDTVAEGKARLKELRQAQLRKYLRTLEAASYYQRGENLMEVFRRVVDEP
jgi:hypothetical protein